LLAPADQAEFDTSEPFRWDPVAGAEEYCLTVGTTAGSDDVVNSGPLAPNQTGFQVAALPIVGVLHARLYCRVAGSWSHTDVAFTAVTAQAVLTWPADGAAGVDPNRPFSWTRVPWATNYWLTVGTTEGGSDLLNTGPLPAGQTSFAALPPLPPGVPLYARLLTSDGANWTYTQVTFTAAGS
jgi:hypothetical protein